MKKDIHPEYTDTQVTCTCGNTFTTRSTITSGTMRADVCSQCHPVSYTHLTLPTTERV